MEYDFQNRILEYDQESNRIPMEYNCHIFSKYLVFQMKDLVFQSKYLVFRLETLDLDRSTRYFESEISKYQVFHTLNSKYQVFRAKGLVFKKGVKSPVISGFYVCPLASAIQSKFQVFKILGISLEISSFLNSRCERPSISKFLIQNPRFSIKILGILIEILGFSFEILGISKICDKHTQEHYYESNHIPMEYDCHIFSKYVVFQMKYLVFQMKDLVFQSKYLKFRLETLDFDQNTRYFESEIFKYQLSTP